MLRLASNILEALDSIYKEEEMMANALKCCLFEAYKAAVYGEQISCLVNKNVHH